MMAILRILSIEETLPEVGSRQHYKRRQWSQTEVTRTPKPKFGGLVAPERLGHLIGTFGQTLRIDKLRCVMKLARVWLSAPQARPISRVRESNLSGDRLLPLREY